MNSDAHATLLQRLLETTRPSEVAAVLADIGDHPELATGEAFGGAGYKWQFFGDRESNISTINLASKPGRSLTERITNGIDGVLEKRMARHAGSAPTSPMNAAAQWFGRPPSTNDSGIFNWKEYHTQGYDKLVRVVLTSGDEDTMPSIDVIDDGIGIEPSNFKTTILSLQQGNKIKRRYLAGAFGQGGSSTLGFCEYALIVSRHIDKPTVVGFTVVKLLRLGEGYKEDAYAYLAVDDEAGNKAVPSYTLAETLDLYPSLSSDKPDGMVTGTLVRHYGYQLDGLDSTLGPSPGNLYHTLQCMMFDPLLPFRLIDVRKPGATKNELISGSRNRLMKYVEEGAKSEDDGSEEAGTELRHHAPREMVSPRGDEPPSIGVEYWVIFNRRRRGEKIQLRKHSNELFVENNRPVVGTVNGQNQGELAARILRDLGLSMVAKHIVIHIDASQCSSDLRRKLFASTREGFRDGEVLNELTRVISNMLSDDQTLADIERELLEDMLKKGSTEARSEVKKEIANLLRNSGFEVRDPGDVLVASSTGTTTVVSPPKAGKKPMQKAPPLKTLPYPQVTRFEIAYPLDILRVCRQDNHSIRIESDADFRYDREQRIAIRTEPARLEVAAKGVLHGGRMHWRLRPREDSQPGDKGEVIATLTRPDGSQLEARVPFEVLPAREEPARKEKGLVPAFEIKAVDPEVDSDLFEQIWDDPNTETKAVAYKAVKTGDSLTIYYSIAFGAYAEQLERLKSQPAMAAYYNQNYEVWIGYHAILQYQQRITASAIHDLQDEQMERLMEHERAVVAAMQVKQALKMAEIQTQNLKNASG